MWTRVCFSLRTYQDGSRAQAAAPASAFSLSFFLFSFVRGFNADQTGMTWRVGELFLKTLLSTIWVPCFCPSIRSAPAAKHPARVAPGTKHFQLFKSCRVNTSRVIRSRGSQNDSAVKWDNSFSIVCWCRATEPAQLSPASKWQKDGKHIDFAEVSGRKVTVAFNPFVFVKSLKFYLDWKTVFLKKEKSQSDKIETHILNLQPAVT